MPKSTGRHVTPGASLRFIVSTEQLDSGAPLVSVSGEVDLATAPVLERSLIQAAEHRTGNVIVDLTRCTFLDSKGLAALLATRARLARANRVLALILSGPTVVKIFEITGLDHLFDIYPTLTMAIQGEPARATG